MPCDSLLSPDCSLTEYAVGKVAASAANGILDEIAKAIQDGVAWVVGNSISWWVRVPSPDLATESAVDRLREWTLPIAIAVAVLGVLSAGGKMALTRKGSPLVDVGSGLVVIAATSTIGVLTASMLVKAGDAWSTWVLDTVSHDDFGRRLTKILALTGAAPGVVIVLGIVAILIGVVQAVLMLFREAALVVLAGLLPLAAAGSMTVMIKPWFRKVTGWMLALIFYKPAVAAVFATTFTMVGEGKDVRTILMGFAMMLLSLIAMPVLMKFFTWTTGSLATSGGGGGILGASVAGAVALSSFRNSSSSSSPTGASSHADYLSSQLGSTRAPNGAPSSSGATTAGSTAAGAGAKAAGPAAAAAATAASGVASGAKTAANSMREDHQR
ncbi:hypothetical protein [Microbispora hainanensis]|uniref:Type IV secretion system protein n=1 Tax=Microbispora hainanensis TaxID=568844 RepID=A0A544YA17_9ACTN|nr:hypothetical protein [Microbispora hainanensis]TQS13588.1 hypothetical protein FLX08_35025 [Microbispora hainanensis]